MLRLKRETPTAYLWSINSQLPPLQHDELTPKRWDLWGFRKARLSVAEKYILKMPFKFTTKEGMNVITWLHYDKWQVWLQAARRQQYVSPFQTIHPPVKYDPIPKSDHLMVRKSLWDISHVVYWARSLASKKVAGRLIIVFIKICRSRDAKIQAEMNGNLLEKQISERTNLFSDVS